MILHFFHEIYEIVDSINKFGWNNQECSWISKTLDNCVSMYLFIVFIKLSKTFFDNNNRVSVGITVDAPVTAVSNKTNDI